MTRHNASKRSSVEGPGVGKGQNRMSNSALPSESVDADQPRPARVLLVLLGVLLGLLAAGLVVLVVVLGSVTGSF